MLAVSTPPRLSFSLTHTQRFARIDPTGRRIEPNRPQLHRRRSTFNQPVACVVALSWCLASGFDRCAQLWAGKRRWGDKEHDNIIRYDVGAVWVFREWTRILLCTRTEQPTLSLGYMVRWCMATFIGKYDRRRALEDIVVRFFDA